jgi:hypothetical protein
MAESIHKLSNEELTTLAQKAIDAKANAYCKSLHDGIGSLLLCFERSISFSQRPMFFSYLILFQCRLTP